MIDQTNFETWFFMYADNELSANERLQVEEFVRANPFCHQSFELINQIKFQQEKIQFPGKEHLYAEPIALDDLHFEPDMSIVYPSKSKLYKKASFKKENGYMSMAIAASVLLLIGLFILFKEDSTKAPGIPITKYSLDRPASMSKPEVVSIVSTTAKQQSKKPASLSSYHAIKNIPDEVPVVEKEQSVTQAIIENQTEETVVATLAQSNLSEEVLKAAESRMALSAQPKQDAIAINTEMIIEASVKDKEKGRLRGLVRKLTRQIFKEDETSNQEKVIQVASFVIPVSNKK